MEKLRLRSVGAKVLCMIPSRKEDQGGSAALISTVGAQEMQKAEMAGLCVLSSAPKRLLPQSMRLSAAIGALEANERLRCKEG